MPISSWPGTYWHYGIGIGWLGKVIEKLSGQSLNDFMTENVFKPLEMYETSFDISKLGEDRGLLLVWKYQKKSHTSQEV